MNSIIIKGNLTRDPELRTTPAGKPVANTAVAVSRAYKDAEGNHPTDFFNITAWGKLGEFLEKYFTKGQEILVSGSMESRTYEKDGVKRTAWDLNADRIEFCGSKKDSAGTSNNGVAPAYADPAAIDDSDLPF